MALKKYRFFVGACGPTMMYSNIIRAEDEISATKIFLAEMNEEPTEENIQKRLRNIREVVPKAKPEKLLDCTGREISVGDNVMAIKGASGTAPELVPGTVEKIPGKSIVVKISNGDTVRIALSKYETDSLAKVIVLDPRPERGSEGVLDASGYPIEENDKVAYVYSPYSTSELKIGTIKKLSSKTVLVDDTRKRPDKVVVLNR